MAQVKDITDEQFNQEALNAEEPVLIQFWAPWCGPCKMLMPVVEDVAEELNDSLKVCRVNVDENTETPGQYGVMSIPTMVLLKEGEIQDQIVGYLPKEELKEKLQESLN